MRDNEYGCTYLPTTTEMDVHGCACGPITCVCLSVVPNVYYVRMFVELKLIVTVLVRRKRRKVVLVVGRDF